jgi:hypothetical protein
MTKAQFKPANEAKICEAVAKGVCQA